jgi:hypothetical protein
MAGDFKGGNHLSSHVESLRRGISVFLGAKSNASTRRPSQNHGAEAFACILMLTLSCADSGKQRLESAQQKYAELVQKGVSPRSDEFKQLLKFLDSVPTDSKAYARAASLRKNIEAARAGFIESPLVAPTDAVNRGERPEAMKLECEKLARELSPLTGEARARQIERIRACQRQLHHSCQHDGGIDPHL